MTAGEVTPDFRVQKGRNPFCVRADADLFRVDANDLALEPSARAVAGKLKAQPGIGR